MTTDTNDSSRESGALVSFIVIGVILAGLVLGGIYLAKNRGGSVAVNSPEIAKNDDNKTGTTSGTSTENKEDKDAKDADPANNNNTGNIQQTVTPGVERPSTAPPASNGRPAENGRGGNVESATTAPRTGGQTTDIPATGVEELMITTIGVTALTYYTVQYLQSRRRLQQ